MLGPPPFRKPGGYPMVAAFDVQSALLIMFVILVLTAVPKATPLRIETLGFYAVKAVWAKDSNDDVDLYVRDPQGHIVYFANQDAGLLHLEYDDMGTGISGTYTLPSGKKVVVHENSERTVVRGVDTGEYTVNLQMYRKDSTGPVRVTVQLWRLRGNDTVAYERTVALSRKGQEETAFRITMRGSGDVGSFNTLPRKFVGVAAQQGAFAPSPPIPPSGPPVDSGP